MLSKSRVKYIQSLHHKKFREEHKAFLVEGTKMLDEAIAFAPHQIQHIYAVPEWLSSIEQLPESFKALTEEISPLEMDKLTTLHTPPGVLVEMKSLEHNASDYRGLTLLLDEVRDPGNLGTIIRSADWFGVKNIVCGPGTVDIYNSKVIQASMGSIFRVTVVYDSLIEFINSHEGTPVIVSHLQGIELPKMDWPENAFLVIGNESKGVSDEIAARADLKIKIPGFGQAESLNASIATAILLYEWKC